jgi:hypothetical protein
MYCDWRPSETTLVQHQQHRMGIWPAFVSQLGHQLFYLPELKFPGQALVIHPHVGAVDNCVEWAVLSTPRDKAAEKRSD